LGVHLVDAVAENLFLGREALLGPGVGIRRGLSRVSKIVSFNTSSNAQLSKISISSGSVTFSVDT
jgi:hypothetical protein